MRAYLDPKSYIYTEEEWDNFSFAGKLDELLSALDRMTELEKRWGSLWSLFKFRVDEGHLAEVYESVPFLEGADCGAYYKQQFRRAILPDLLRRFEYCPRSCEGLRDDPLQLPAPANDNDDVAARFIRSLEVCAICSDTRGTCIFRTAAAYSTVPGSSFFQVELLLGDSDPLRCLTAADLLPLEGKPGDDDKLKLALTVELSKLAAQDPAWQNLAVGDLSVAEEFWASLRHADFRGADAQYKERIVYTILQLVTGRDVTANEHAMNGQVVHVAGVNQQKWNAYVFQMGASDQDRRCSRIYYTKSGAGIRLYEYEGNAHA